MSSAELSAVFAEMADIMEVLGEDRFRVNSYRRAARTLSETTEDLAALAEAGRLESLPGIGKSTAAKIAEYLRTGQIAQHRQLREKVPPELMDLLAVQGLGPKTVAKLWREADIKSPGELRRALEVDPERLERLEGLGAKKVAQLREALQFAERSAGRFTLDEAEQVAATLCRVVAACKGAGRVEVAGSLRRGRETVGDIDVLCEADEEHAQAIIAAFASAEGVSKVLAAGRTKGSVIVAGRIQADLRVVPSRSFGAALAYFTGSKAHNVALREYALRKGFKLNEYGLFKRTAGGRERQVAGATEEDIYDALDLPWIPPELREDRGELDAAVAGRLPRLVSLADIRGDLHLHTTASDGADTIEEMIRACRSLGYKYMAITDHSKSQIQANGLDERRLAEHVGAIRAAARKYKDILVLAGVEVDVMKDGRLDFPDEVLAGLDLVTASPHSALSQRGAEATERLIRAVENPHVDVIGHPTGRLINRRAGMDIDIVRLARAAAANDTAIEINAHPWRLDLRDVHVRAAVEVGAKLLICTDAHNARDDLTLMRFGVTTARRGWARPADVINTYTPARLRKWLHRG